MAMIYSPGIHIVAARTTGGAPQSLSPKKAKDFTDTTVRYLNKIKSLASGAAMMAEMDASGHVVKIYRTWDAEEGNCEFGDDPATAMVVPLSKLHKKGETELARVLARATADMSQRSKLKKFFRVGHAQPKFLKFEAIARLVGVSTRDLEAMAAGTKMIPLAVNSRLLSYLYDFLTPGAGSDCGIQFNHIRDKLSTGHKRHVPMSDLWENRPPGVALAHEMVHAWRCMVGRVLFDYGWEEEAMTVGLPPFSSMGYTENRIRAEWGGLAIRGDYKYQTFESGMFDGNSKIGIGADKEWLGDHSKLAVPMKDRPLHEQIANRRKAMGYDDDDGFE